MKQPTLDFGRLLGYNLIDQGKVRLLIINRKQSSFSIKTTSYLLHVFSVLPAQRISERAKLPMQHRLWTSRGLGREVFQLIVLRTYLRLALQNPRSLSPCPVSRMELLHVFTLLV